MSLLSSNNSKEQQKINDLELKINREKQKLNKKLTRQKILLGAFLIKILEDNEVKGLHDYVIDNLGKFLTKENDKDLMSEVIDKLKDINSRNDKINYKEDEGMGGDTLIANIVDTGFLVDEDNMFVEE